jgi:hypothetical protein
LFASWLKLTRFRWNIVSVLVLLCQGLLFEASDRNDSGIVVAFGILISVMVVSCLLFSAGKIISSYRNRNNQSTLLFPHSASHKLPRPDLLEIYLIHTLRQIEENNELWINLNTWRKLMTKSEFENLISATSDPNRVEIDANLLGEILKENDGSPYERLLKDYQLYNLKS